jgi:hypothetical protein
MAVIFVVFYQACSVSIRLRLYFKAKFSLSINCL